MKEYKTFNNINKHALSVDVNFHVYAFVPDFVVSELRADVPQTCFPTDF